LTVRQIDWDDLAGNLVKLEADCRASWDHLHVLEKHDSVVVSKNRSVLDMCTCTQLLIV